MAFFDLPPDPRKPKRSRLPLAKKRKKKKAPKKRPKVRETAVDEPVPIKKCAGARLAPDKFGGSFCTARSPGGIPDPKVDAELIEAALQHVGTPKQRRNVTLKKKTAGGRRKTVVEVKKSRSYGFPKDADYMTVAYGGGADSTAVLIGLDQLWRETRDPKWVPRAVTFADTGGEHPHTYDYIVRVLEPWLRTKAFRGAPGRPRGVVKVAYSTLQRGGGWGTGYTLEQQSLVNQSLPSISMGGHTCSTKYKIDAQQQWFDAAIEAGSMPPPRKGRKILRAIGYDATEADRLEGHSTYVAQDEEGTVYKAWYPLIEWGWNRARCLAEAKVALGQAPAKSSCWFCGAMRPNEIVLLAQHYPELLKRALFLENVAIHGRHRPHTGLNRKFHWTDFALGDVDKLPPMAAVFIAGGVIRRGRTKNRVLKDSLGKPPPPDLAPNETYVEGVGQLMSQGAVNRIVRQAKAYVKAAPDRGERIHGWRNLRGKEKPKGRKTRTVTVGGKKKRQVWALTADKSKKGQLNKDMALHPMTKKIPAFSDVLGFRCWPDTLSWNTLLDKHLPAAERKGDEVSAEKAERIVERTVHGCRRATNPPRHTLPVIYSSPALTGF